ncbi:MAG TPA: glycoside hydrolase family 3 N-terminal domain-containing protein [Gaiellaceae bacterium]|nr:glycoside hydrolase family 3 N-terminal domain-containing protein [Gaiellaceae bacterium]
MTAAPAAASPAGQVMVDPLWGPPTQGFLARVSAGQVGGVILLGDGWTSESATASAIARVQAAACVHGNGVLVGVDQEGGTVRRLPWAAPAVAAAQMTTPARAHAEAAAAARALRAAGISIDFAPVADVVTSAASFEGTRSFGRDPAQVAGLVGAFVGGLQTGGVAGTAKHFPGLGSATASTDDRPVTIGRGKAFLTARLAPFRAAISQGVKLVMVASASYPALDPSGTPALFSKPIVTGLLRGTLGFEGVVVTDALDTPALRSQPDVPGRAIAAGVDLLLYSHESPAELGYAQLLRDAKASAAIRADLAAAGARIASLKAWLAANGGPLCGR